MKVSFADGVLKVVTNITESVAKKGISTLNVVDEKKGELYNVQLTTDGSAALSKFGMKANTVIDGKVAVVIVVPAGKDMEYVKKTYGEALLAADTYTEQIARDAEGKEAAIEELFEEAE